MIRLCLIFIVVVLFGCGEDGSGGEAGMDSASTDSLTDPSYNPRMETDSAARQMNLDSTEVNDRDEQAP
jgi:hypothetical protein